MKQTRGFMLAVVSILALTTILVQRNSVYPSSAATDTQPTSHQSKYHNSRKWNFTIARVLGPGLPPLECENQTSVNLMKILSSEKPLSATFSLVRVFWVVQCMINKEEHAKIVKLLLSFKQEFYQVENCTQDKSTMLEQLLNVNVLRNIALSKGFSQPTDWFIALDGMTFLTHESIRSLAASLANADENDQTIALIPYLRLLSCQKLISADTTIGLFENHPSFLSTHQESQIAISKHVMKRLRMQSFYNEKNSYGQNDKLGLINDMIRKSPDRIACRKASPHFASKHVDADDFELMSSCGYVIRLLYWPTTENVNECSDVSLASQFLRPELNIFSRGKLRTKSRKMLANQVAELGNT